MDDCCWRGHYKRKRTSVVLRQGTATFVLTAVGFRIAVVEEEAHLTTLYGDAYRTYIRQVGRFLPRIVRRHATGATT
jgi:protein-S-isoprenylcysteine O-methyltransferase Ste14